MCLSIFLLGLLVALINSANTETLLLAIPTLFCLYVFLCGYKKLKAIKLKKLNNHHIFTIEDLAKLLNKLYTGNHEYTLYTSHPYQVFKRKLNSSTDNSSFYTYSYYVRVLYSTNDITKCLNDYIKFGKLTFKDRKFSLSDRNYKEIEPSLKEMKTEELYNSLKKETKYHLNKNYFCDILG